MKEGAASMGLGLLPCDFLISLRDGCIRPQVSG